MPNFVLKMDMKSVMYSEYRCILMVDFEDIEDALRILKPGIGPTIAKFFNIAFSDKVHYMLKVLTINEFNENHVELLDAMLNGYIINGTDKKVRVSRPISDVNFGEIIPTNIIRISVFEERCDMNYPKDDIIGKYLNYKKISGEITYVRAFESSAPLVELISSIRDLTKDDENLGFLVEYHDVKISTVKFVESIMSKIDNNHCSFNIDSNNQAEKSIDYLVYTQPLVFDRSLNEQNSIETIILIDD